MLKFMGCMAVQRLACWTADREVWGSNSGQDNNLVQDFSGLSLEMCCLPGFVGSVTKNGFMLCHNRPMYCELCSEIWFC